MKEYARMVIGLRQGNAEKDGTTFQNDFIFYIYIYKWSVLMRALQCNSCTLSRGIRPYFSPGLTHNQIYLRCSQNNFIQNSFISFAAPIVRS